MLFLCMMYVLKGVYEFLKKWYSLNKDKCIMVLYLLIGLFIGIFVGKIHYDLLIEYLTSFSENVKRSSSTFDYDTYSQMNTTQNFNDGQTNAIQNFNDIQTDSKVNPGKMDLETFFNNTHRTQCPICHEWYQSYLCHYCLDLGTWLEEDILKYKNSHPSENVKDFKYNYKDVFADNIVEFISVIKHYYEIVDIPEHVLFRVSETDCGGYNNTDFGGYNLLCILMILVFI